MGYNRVAEENPNPNQAITPEETSIRDFIERIEKGKAILLIEADLPIVNHPMRL